MKKIALGIILIAAGLNAHAQRMMGVATSNWSGLSNVYLNPANIADSRYKFSIDVLSINVGADNDLGTINAGNVLKEFVKGDSLGLNKIVKLTNNGQFNMQAPYAEVRLPSFMFSFNHKNSIALTLRVRGMNQFSNFDQTLFRELTNNSLNTSGSNTFLNLSNFKWTMHAWSEIGVTYGKVLLERSKHELKGGLTLKYLGGIAYAGFKGNQFQATYNVYQNQSTQLIDSTTLDVKSSNVEYASNIYKDASQLRQGLSATDIADYFFGKKGGYGLGADVGLVYEFRPHPERYEYEMDGRQHMDLTKNRYKLRLSVAVTDIGSILYNNNNLTANVTGSGHISSNEPSTNFKDFNDVKNYAMSHGFTLDTSNSKSTRVYLPTALVAGIDYHITGRFYANLTYMADLTNHNNFGNNIYNQLTVTPRYDSRGISFAVPITYSQLTNSIKGGLGMRYGGFFIGSDDMLALFNNNQYGFNVYTGIFVPINKKRIKDYDHDHVSDAKDLCPTIPGTWAAHGCPDRDHDGVPDMDDRCPDDSGSVELQGCPDRDDDGVADIDDKCPDVPGLEQYNGCPDTDHDGIPDNEDLCPDKPGPAKWHGCPDTDGDGVPDNEDLCPLVPGLASNHGCPLEEKKGPHEKAKELKAPEMNEAKQKIEYAAKALQFETGKSVIKKASFKSLDEVVKILKATPDAYMTIDGYTDNVGKPEKNMELSGNRADAVKNYFVKHGIAAGRLISTGHGDTNPIAPNTTAEGRARNRRVVMDMKTK